MTEQQERIDKLIARIEEHQKALGFSDVRFVARYLRYLGSTKTWRNRFIARNWAELPDLNKWEGRLAKFVLELDGATPIVDFFDALPIAAYGQEIYDTLAGQKSDRRCAFLIGPTGVGKSWTMIQLVNRNKQSAVYIHAHKGWNESMPRIARALARATGATQEVGASATFDNALESLRAHPLTLCIDDVHEGGVLMLKLIKTVIDETHARFILGTYPTSWTRLVNGSTDAQAEAQQLLGRTLKPIETRWIGGATQQDVEGYLKAAANFSGSALKVLAGRITSTVRKNGNLRFLADSVELAQSNADETRSDVTCELVEAAVVALATQERR